MRLAALALLLLASPAAALDASSTSPPRSAIPSMAVPYTVSAMTLSGYAGSGDKGAGCVAVRGWQGGPNAIQDANGAWWQALIGKPMDVTCFGAKMDGQTDDTPALQAAITAAQLSGTGGQVTIPAGSIILGGVRIPSNIRLSGAGPGATNVVASNSAVDVFTAADPTSIANVAIERLSIYGAGYGRQAGGHFVLFQNCTNCRVSDFGFNGAYVGAEVTGANTVNVHLDSGRSDGAAAYHFVVSGGSDTFLRGLLTTAGGGAEAICGLRLTQSGGTWISDSDFTYSGHGTCVQPDAGQSVNWTFASNTALGDSGSGFGLFLNPRNGGSISGFSATGSWTSANKQAGVATQCDNGGIIQAVTLSGHRAIANTADGMTFTCGDGIRIVAPTVVANSNPNGGGVAGRNSGIVFASGLLHFSVLGGEFRPLFGSSGYQAYGVRVLPGASDYYTIRDIDAVGSGSVDDRGTGSHKTVTGNW